MVVPTSLEIPEEKVDETTENRFTSTSTSTTTLDDKSICTPSIPVSDDSQEFSHKKYNIDLSPENTQSVKKQKI